MPRTPLNYDAELLTAFRPPSARLDVVQPDGPGFRVEGRKVTWENWDFRVGFNGREGLVLHRIGYTVDGRRRPVVYRASIAEMVVPYGTPERSHYRKNVFDSGELGFGRMANSLTLGCDCLGAIHYFDAVVPDIFGSPRIIENCICLHEEDAGLLGNISTSAPAAPKCGARGSSWSRPSRRSAITNTRPTGTCTRTAASNTR